MKKRLVESLEMVLVSDPNICIVADNMVAEWGGVTYPQLSVILSHLKFLSSLHQNHHWITNGDPFYGDHLLFQRLYEGAIEDIDAIAEKSIGVGSTYNVDINLTTQQMHKLIQGSGMSSTIPQKSDLARSSYLAEMNFLKVVSHLVDQMKESNSLSRGVDNLIAGIEDKHEGFCYLLKQRINSGK